MSPDQDTVSKDVLATIEKYPGIFSSAIYARHGRSRSVRNALAEMVRNGTLVVWQDGPYRRYAVTQDFPKERLATLTMVSIHMHGGVITALCNARRPLSVDEILSAVGGPPPTVRTIERQVAELTKRRALRPGLLKHGGASTYRPIEELCNLFNSLKLDAIIGRRYNPFPKASGSANHHKDRYAAKPSRDNSR